MFRGNGDRGTRGEKLKNHISKRASVCKLGVHSGYKVIFAVGAGRSKFTSD